jgi:hypothetical protein
MLAPAASHGNETAEAVCATTLAIFEAFGRSVELVAIVANALDEIACLLGRDLMFPGEIIHLVTFAAGDLAPILLPTLRFIIGHLALLLC